jgi:steroid 5-alpha reductase family enzyme
MKLILWILVDIQFVMLLIWLISILIRNPGIIDFFWSVMLTVVGDYYLSFNMNYRSILILSLLSFWGIRLALYMFISRIVPRKVEKRYIRLSQGWKSGALFGFFINFQFQGLCVWLMTLVFWLASLNTASNINYVDYLATVLCIVGIIGEICADVQLSNFKKINVKAVCNVGLWKYSRHPNLFFDWLVWVGFFVFGLSSKYGYAGIISPILLYIIMTKMTGPITEKMSVESRGEAYLHYQKKTAYFFPRVKIFKK